MATEQPSPPQPRVWPPIEIPRGQPRGRILWSRVLSPVPNGCDCHDNADFSLRHLLGLGACWVPADGLVRAAVSTPCAPLFPSGSCLLGGKRGGFVPLQSLCQQQQMSVLKRSRRSRASGGQGGCTGSIAPECRSCLQEV